ncbi:hypothetical protein ACFQGW_22285 [Xanthomonas theicola]|uniref:hypothetical protein n=1 Tax=Xanthomonas theicola TaxID=56464 RepID=UPI0016397CA5|nr:hypothetical protein [Xanthomonas theicola]QNH24973.1 hypothetical protein G4Q83_09750 [Xanthomonas theicola]
MERLLARRDTGPLAAACRQGAVLPPCLGHVARPRRLFGQPLLLATRHDLDVLQGYDARDGGRVQGLAEAFAGLS